MTTPTLKTARLTLVYPLVHNGMTIGHYLNWLHNENVTKYSEQRHLKHTASSQYEYIAGFSQTHNHFWEIQRQATPIGSITAYCDKYNRVANVGIMIGETWVWGRGYGAEAWNAVCEFLFSDGIRKIEASCMACNAAMEKILTKTGFRYEATVGGHFLLNGKPEDKVCYGKYKKAEIIPLNKEQEQAGRPPNAA